MESTKQQNIFATSNREITRVAYLPSMGMDGLNATRHVYTHSAIEKCHPSKPLSPDGVVHYYKCTVTGAVRRWGFDAIRSE